MVEVTCAAAWDYVRISALQERRARILRFWLALWVGLTGWIWCGLSNPAFANECGWREPGATYSPQIAWTCRAHDWLDGDTLIVRCGAGEETIRIRLRGVDTPERGEAGWEEARTELRRLTEGMTLTVRPRHNSWNRVVADVLVGKQNIGRRMDAAGWSKSQCPRR